MCLQALPDIVVTQGHHLVTRPPSPPVPLYNTKFLQDLDEAFARCRSTQSLRRHLYGTPDAEEYPAGRTPPSVRKRYLAEQERALQEFFDTMTPSDAEVSENDLGQAKTGLLTPASGSRELPKREADADSLDQPDVVRLRLCPPSSLPAKELHVEQSPVQGRKRSISQVEDPQGNDRPLRRQRPLRAPDDSPETLHFELHSCGNNPP